MARPRSDIEPRILAAARARFLRDGVDGASLRGIASDAKTSIGMVYYYFPTKDELFLAVVEEVYEGLLQGIEGALAPNATVPVRLERLLARVADISDEELEVVRLVAREALQSSERRERLLDRFQRGHIPVVARFVADGFADGTFSREVHPFVTMLSIAGIGVVPQVIRRVLGERVPFVGAPAGRELASALARVLFTGVGAGSSSAARKESLKE